MMRHDLFPSCRAFVLQEVASAVLMVVMGIFCWKLNLAGTFYIARKKVMVILARESLSRTSGLVLCCCKWHSIQKPYNLRGQASRGLMWYLCKVLDHPLDLVVLICFKILCFFFSFRTHLIINEKAAPEERDGWALRRIKYSIFYPFV